MPRVEVEGVGLISFPVPEAQVHQFVQQATRAPYGRGEDTLHDESVRKTWQLPASQVRIGGKPWGRTFTQLLNAVVAGLGCATAKTIRRSGNTFARIRFVPDWCRHRRAGRVSVACTRFGGLFGRHGSTALPRSGRATLPRCNWNITLMKMNINLSPKQREELLAALKTRFERNMARHQGLVWAKVQARLESRGGGTDKLWSLAEMERTGGEPDVVGHDQKSGGFIFFDCSEQTPAGRVSLCYDNEALASRKEHKPKGSAVGLAAAMGIELLTEGQYLDLQKLGEFDAKRSSWLKTPADFRAQGGALWGGRSYGRVFIGCNGAESYYQVRGFRGVLKV